MKRYSPKDIENKWQKKWDAEGTYTVNLDSKKPKYIGFGMFNYPSGAGIHVGHVRNFTIPDIMTRAKRQQGFASYQPIGWDSFGLPAENYAIKTGVSPQESTKTAIKKYHEQYKALGWSVDWTKEINTTDPSYYKWTQWVFTKLFEHKLAYQQESPQWWCDQCKTVLADEQVLSGKCWRHDGSDDPLVTKRNLKQWFFKITDYADAMLDATDDLDWTQSVKASQQSWIGRSIGAEVTFTVDGHDKDLTVFTTRPDTLFGATFIVLAPEHPLVDVVTTGENRVDVTTYAKAAITKSEVQRQQDADKEKTGLFTGAFAINPVNGKKVPIWVADYVLMGYGTGAIMAVPAHDVRDNAFAKKFDLDIVRVIANEEADDACTHAEGVLINSGEYNDMPSAKAREQIVTDLQKKGLAQEKVNYKMRDWLISRQRYWGAPIPIIHCESCGPVAVPEKDLPVELPHIENYRPTGGNVSVLAGVEEWVNAPCPKCSGPGKRETDTMDGYVCSSWYFLRYMDPTNNLEAWGKDRVHHWAPIDFYNGGDHATAHLLYARFFMHFFHSLGLVNTTEPFKKMIFNGKIKAGDGSPFSKSKGNGIDPLAVIEQGYGADAIRLYEMFAAPVELDVLWDEQGIPGAYRFLNRVWTITQEFLDAPKKQSNDNVIADIRMIEHKAIEKVTDDIDGVRFNTAIAALMEAVNGLYKLKGDGQLYNNDVWQAAIESILQLLAPFAPHITEELWSQLGHTDSIHINHWPKFNPDYLTLDTVTIVVQVNGKLRAQLQLPKDSDKDVVLTAAKADENVKEYLAKGTLVKQIYIPGKLINLVVS
jgi:leucyl-tRNA synthetase